MPSGEPARDTARQQLGSSQARLVAALVAGGELPDGFDRDRIRVQAAALAAKRAYQVARACPDLAQTLGPSYDPVFRDYASRGPKPTLGGAAADGKAFARYLRGAGTGQPAGVRRAARRALHRATARR